MRDIGRVLQMPYGQVDRLSQDDPRGRGEAGQYRKRLADEPRLREEAKNEEVVARLLDYGQQVEGLAAQRFDPRGGCCDWRPSAWTRLCRCIKTRAPTCLRPSST